MHVTKHIDYMLRLFVGGVKSILRRIIEACNQCLVTCISTLINIDPYVAVCVAAHMQQSQSRRFSYNYSITATVNYIDSGFLIIKA